MRRRWFSAVRAAVAARALAAKPAFQGALLGVGAAAAQLAKLRLAALPAAGRLYELDEWGDLQARAHGSVVALTSEDTALRRRYSMHVNGVPSFCWLC